MQATPVAPTVVRTLGVAAAASIAVSNMIGQGVFLKARAMTCNVGSPALMLAAWLVAGMLALCGALTLAELGAAIPESGGIYAFLRRAYGGAMGFAYGWMSLFVASPASIAALAAGSAIFLNLTTGNALDGAGVSLAFGGSRLGVPGVQIVALALIAVMTAINCAPAVVNGGIATVSAVLKIGMIVAVIFIAVVAGHGSAAHFAIDGAAGTCAGIAGSLRGGVPGFAAALIGALYAYQGWHSLTLVAGEVKAPGRTFPLALGVSVAVVIVLYVGVNAAYVEVLSPLTIANLAATTSVGVTAVATVLGPVWRTVAAGFLFASVIATLHVTILTNSRVSYAFARDTRGLGLLARVSSRGHVPVNAVIVNSVLAAGLVLVGNFDTLSDYLVFNIWVFFVAAGVGVFVLRRREPELNRPYRAFGFPVVPGIYVLVGGWLVVQTAISTPVSSAIGLGIVALSYPVYRLRGRRSRSVP